MSTELKDQITKLINGKPADIWTVKQVIKKIVLHTSSVSSDDVRFYVNKFTPSSMIIGTAFQQLCREGFLEKQGTKKTSIKSSRRRDIVVYVQAPF